MARVVPGEKWTKQGSAPNPITQTQKKVASAPNQGGPAGTKPGSK